MGTGTIIEQAAILLLSLSSPRVPLLHPRLSCSRGRLCIPPSVSLIDRSIAATEREKKLATWKRMGDPVLLFLLVNSTHHATFTIS